MTGALWWRIIMLLGRPRKKLGFWFHQILTLLSNYLEIVLFSADDFSEFYQKIILEDDFSQLNLVNSSARLRPKWAIFRFAFFGWAGSQWPSTSWWSWATSCRRSTSSLALSAAHCTPIRDRRNNNQIWATSTCQLESQAPSLHIPKLEISLSNLTGLLKLI